MTQDEIKTALSASGLAAITDPTDFAAIRRALEKLGEQVVGMDRLSRELVAAAATAELDDLNVKRASRVVEAALKVAREAVMPEAQAVIAPASEPVDGEQLLHDLVEAFDRYLWLPQWAALKLALFTIYSHAYECFDVSPLLLVTSAAMGSGKTRVLEVLERLVRLPFRNLSVTTASLARRIDAVHPTVLYDESDNIDQTARRDLIAILNGGHTRNAANQSLCVGDEHASKQFNVYCPKVFAGNLNFFPETTWSRAILIEMEPRPKEFTTARLNTPEANERLSTLSARAMRWVNDHVHMLRVSEPFIPSALPDRVADNWSPFFAIADAIGAEWGEQARKAAIDSVATASELPEGRELLLNIRQVFVERGVDRVQSKELVDALNGNDEWRWKYRQGGLTPHALGKLLKPFRIKSKSVYFNAGVPPVAKGFMLSQFQHAFATHLQHVVDDDASDHVAESGGLDGAGLTDITVMPDAPASPEDAS